MSDNKTTAKEVDLQIQKEIASKKIETSLLSDAYFQLKKTTNKLKETNEKFSIAFSAVPYMILITKISDGTIVEVNEGYTRLSGYTREESLGKTTSELSIWADPKDRENFVAGLKKFGELTDFETRFRRKDGTVATVLNSVRNIVLNGEKHALSIGYDITDNKLKEREMSNLKKAVETSGEAIYMTDKDGIITFINLEFTNLYGYTIDEVVGKVTPRILKSGLRKADEYVKLWSDLSAGKIVKDEHVNKTKDGKLLIVSSSANPIVDEKNNIMGFLAIQHDITKQKELENNLKESEEKYHNLIENTPDAIVVYDADGKIIFTNRESLHLIGATSDDELIGKSVMQFIHPDSRTLVIERMKKSIEEKNILDIAEEKFIRIDGSIVEVEVKSIPIKFENKQAVQVIIRDITERKNLEESKISFLAIASHQLRTPLSATKWVLDSLIDDNNFNSKQLKKLNDLVFSNERLINLVEDLLKVSTIETGKLIVNKTSVDLEKLINDLSLSLKILLDKKKKNIKIILPPKLEPVYCDPVLIHESLQNLLNNALIYSKEDSKEISVTVEERKDDYLVSVHNEGYIDPVTSDKIKIFDKFSRGSKSSEVSPSGSGLGLYITKKMVEASGGTIGFTSNVESGTTFYLTIVKRN